MRRPRPTSPTRGKKIALVHMPFADCELPSLGLSLLKAALQKVNLGCDILYLNLRFAEQVDYEAYRRVCEGEPAVHDLLGEWVFTDAFWGPNERRGQAYLENVLQGSHPHHHKADPDSLSDLMTFSASLRDGVEPFLSAALSDVPWGEYAMVGFSSTFQQQLASLALGSRLKRLYPRMTIVFGGANCEGVMGRTLLENFPFVDAVCIGEGDLCFPPYAESVMNGLAWEADPLLITRDTLSSASCSSGLQTRVRNMDELPFPDLADYFKELASSSLACVQPKMVFESSRGCWWGQKSQCTFCGLNGGGMEFRQKSADRVWKEILWMVERHGSVTRSVVATDNIMPRDMLRDVLPRLHELGLDLFYETKSNLKLEDIQMFAKSGIKNVQPGIESLSSQVLKLMRKGVSGLQNVQTLKFCREAGVAPTWNYLMGFPGEGAKDYQGQADWIPSLHHLPPPQYCGPIRIDRFSPYFSDPEKFGLETLEPYWSYLAIYPGLPEGALRHLAYFFVSPVRLELWKEPYICELARRIGDWKAKASHAMLRLFDLGTTAIVLDTRLSDTPVIHELRPVERAILEQTDFIQKGIALRDKLGRTFDSQEVDNGMLRLIKEGLLLREDDRYLRLVLSARERSSFTPSQSEAVELLPVLAA